MLLNWEVGLSKTYNYSIASFSNGVKTDYLASLQLIVTGIR
jgi:hypothetical protein